MPENQSEVRTLYVNGISIPCEGRKPKGWFHRFELRYSEVRLISRSGSERIVWRWTVSRCLGRNRGMAVGAYEGAPGDVSDSDVMRRCRVLDVTVPVLIRRPLKANGHA